jgi:hypothetical protein
MGLRNENERPFLDLMSSVVSTPNLSIPKGQVPQDHGSLRKPCVPARLDTRMAADVKGRESAVQTEEESPNARSEVVRDSLAIFGFVSAGSLCGWAIMDVVLWFLQNEALVLDNTLLLPQ